LYPGSRMQILLPGWEDIRKFRLKKE